jgi:hypothetical protein
VIGLRHGISRTCILAGPLAIKVPRLVPIDRSLAGVAWTIARAVLANQSEAQTSGVDGVMPVKASLLGGLVNIYPRSEPMTLPHEAIPYDQIGQGWVARDRKPQNVGRYLGQLVWLDYDGSWNGCPHERDVANLARPDDPDESP